MATLPVQTRTPDQLLLRPDKQSLLAAFRGQKLDALRTPAAVIDRAVFARNCARMLESASQWGASFRAHVKTHKVLKPRFSSIRETSEFLVPRQRKAYGCSSTILVGGHTRLWSRR